MRLGLTRQNFPYVIVLFFSLVLSVWICARETVINPDGICYLMAADVFSKLGVNALTNYCAQSSWPFYSIFISLVAQWTHFSLEMSAYLLNGMATLLSVFLFLKIISELGGNTRVLYFAALVILLFHEFNSVREYIIRDHGFWAFYLLSCYLLLRFMRQSNWFYAISFSMSLLLAALFRVEAVIFLLGLPWLIFCDFHRAFKARMAAFFQLNIPLILIIFFAIGWLIAHPAYFELKYLGRLAEIVNQFQHGVQLIYVSYDKAKLALIQNVLPSEATRDANLLLFLMITFWYAINVISHLSYIYFFLVGYAFYIHSFSFEVRAKLVLAGYLFLNFMITAVFFLQHFFLSKRYLMAFSLILMCYVPFALDHLWQRRAQFSYRVSLFIVAFFIFISSLGGIFEFGPSKSYIHEAGNWIDQNVPKTASLYANDFQLMYYTRHYPDDLFKKWPEFLGMDIAKNPNWKSYQFVALRLSHRDDINKMKSHFPFYPIKIFMNNHGDQVIIYQIKEQVS
jgi:hypothetical protein